MQKIMSWIMIVALVAGLQQPASAIWGEQQRDPAQARATFDAIQARLEPGGDLMIIANTEGILENLVNAGMRLAQMAGDEGPGQEALAVIRRAAEFLNQNGFYAVEGLGFSSVPQGDGLHSVSMFVKRDAASAARPLWRATVGGGPVEMEVLDYLPRDTALARAGTGDIRFLWQLVANAGRDIGGEEGEQAFAGWQAMAGAMIGQPIESLVNSLAPQSVIAVQLSRQETVTLPLDDSQPLSIPRPALLMVTAVNDHTLMDTIKTVLAMQLEMPLPESRDGDAVLYPLPMPIPSPIPLSITLATHGNYLLIGSTEAIVREAIAAFRGKDGLKTEAEFQSSFPELGANNGILYISRRFGEIIATVQKQMINQPDNDMPASMRSLMQQWIDEQVPYYSAMTMMNYRGGVHVHGLSSSGGREVIASLTVAPLGMMAAIAIPSFVQARSASQQNMCINNLRQLDAAKEQWALATNAAQGADPDHAGVMEYIRGGSVTCPQGGTYELNAIGTSPACSVHGSLPVFQGW